MTAAEDEFVEFARWLREPSVRGFEDPLHRRIVDVYFGLAARTATPVEFGVLLRQHVRRWPKRDVAVGDEIADLVADRIQALDLSLLRGVDGEFVLNARPWCPEWVWGVGSDPLTQAELDGSSTAGTRGGQRQHFELVAADPAFVDATGYETYRTPGQRSAVRIALEGRPDGLLLACLPTGSGKTEVAVTLARKVNQQKKTSLLVVPTTALAYDLERRLRGTWARHAGGDLSDVPFAWTASTSEGDQAALIGRVQSGSQPVLITSPESLTTRLLGTVRTAAGMGRIGALIVDEAHLVTQWGMGFRPQYRLLGDLWRELNRRCPDGHGVRALLMSATYSGGVVDDLLELFLAGTDIEADFVTANELRPEPDFWVADLTARDVRDAHVLEAVHRLPRPAIVYVTQPKEAERLAQLLRVEGFKRLAVVSGETSDVKRRDAMAGLRTSDGPSRYDVVVATSAFGLGVDSPEVRCVVHACLPESPDRWYQELGRGGRDGHRSTALLLPAHGDEDEAASLGLRALTPEVAAERWSSLWARRQEGADGNTYVCLAASPAGSQDGSYNRRWNQQLLDGLQASKGLRADLVAWDELATLGLDWSARTPPSLPPVWFRVTLSGAPPTSEWFDGPWTEWKTAVEEEDERELRLMRELVRTKNACEVLRSAYGQQRRSFSDRYPDIAAGLGLQSGCGRCQGCLESAIGWFPSGSRPQAKVRSSVPAGSAFCRVVAQHEFTGAGAIGVDSHLVAVVIGEVAPFARRLRSAGARLHVGDPTSAAAQCFEFRDALTDLEWLTPIPAVVELSDVDEVEAALVGLSLRPVPLAPVLLVAPDIPRSVRATAPFRLADFMERAR